MMKISSAIAARVCLLVGLAIQFPLLAQAKPTVQGSNGSGGTTASSSAKPDAGKTTAAPSSAPASTARPNTVPTINADERRRALRERFEKLRRNPQLRQETVKAK